jgi:hypothetical protein
MALGEGHSAKTLLEIAVAMLSASISVRTIAAGGGLHSCREGADDAARELGFVPRLSSDSWDHEVAIRGVYRRWLEMMEREPRRTKV